MIQIRGDNEQEIGAARRKISLFIVFFLFIYYYYYYLFLLCIVMNNAYIMYKLQSFVRVWTN